MVQEKYLNSKLKLFLKKVNKKIKIEKVILFGSRAEGTADKDSDVDLIIVSDYFKEMNFFERVSKMYDFWDLDIPVDFLCYTIDEFNKLKQRITIVQQAVKKGIIMTS